MANEGNGWIKWTWWWGTRGASTTKAQNVARLVMGPIVLITFLLSFLALGHILKAYGSSDRTAALISLFTMFPLALFAGRSISMMICPDLIQEADQDTIGEKNGVLPRK